MNVIYLVLPLAIFLAVVFVAAFIWATRAGQYDDLDSPAVRMLNDDADEVGRGGGSVGGGSGGSGRLARRVAVVDFDVHHGNGTEEIARAWQGMHTSQPFSALQDRSNSRSIMSINL